MTNGHHLDVVNAIEITLMEDPLNGEIEEEEEAHPFKRKYLCILMPRNLTKVVLF